MVVDDAAEGLVRPDHEKLPQVVLVKTTTNRRERRLRGHGPDVAVHDAVDGHGRGYWLDGYKHDVSYRREGSEILLNS